MPNKEIGAFIPTTNIWDPTEIYSTEVTSPEFKELLVRLYQNLNSMAIAINLKDTGYYDTAEFITGQKFFPKPGLTSLSAQTPDFRQAYRKLINFGTLPNAGTTNVAHGITVDANTIFTRIYGVATNPVGLSYLPLPYSSTTLINNIELSVNNTNVTITTGINRVAYTVTYVVLEYIKF